MSNPDSGTFWVDLIGIFPFLVGMFVLLFAFKLIHNWLTPFDDQRELERGNVAASINRAAAYFGVAIAMSGSLIGSSDGYWSDLGMFMLDGVIALVFFAIAFRAFDFFILFGQDNSLEIQRGNMAVALTEASAYLSLGLIMSASFSGSGGTLRQGLFSALLFSVLGLATLIAVYLVYDKVLLRDRDIDAEIADGRVPTAINVGSLLLAMSITLWFSISGDFVSWADDIRSYGAAALACIVALTLARLTSKRLVASNVKATRHTTVITELSVARATLSGALTLAAGLITGLAVF